MRLTCEQASLKNTHNEKKHVIFAISINFAVTKTY